MPDLPGNGTRTVYYNQMATLLFSTGKILSSTWLFDEDALFCCHSGCHPLNMASPSTPYPPHHILHTTGEDAIKQLFARGTHRRYDYSTLLVLGTYYFLGAALCAGSAISSG
jgi:hypothetical protein